MHISHGQLDFHDGNIDIFTGMYLNSQFFIPSMAPVFLILLTFFSDKYSISTYRWALHPSPHCSLEHQWTPCPPAFSWGSQWSHWKMGRWEQSEVNTFILLFPLCYVHGAWVNPFTNGHHTSLVGATPVFQQLLFPCFLNCDGKWLLPGLLLALGASSSLVDFP